MKHVPGLIVKDDSYEVFGKGRPLIYINGRRVISNKEVEQLKSTDIKHIEVISNPGAKYDATVQAVLRIQTVRKAGDGLSIDAWNRYRQGKYAQNDVSIDANYRTGGLDLFASYWTGIGKWEQKADIDQEVHGTMLWHQSDTLWQQRNDMTILMTETTHTIEGGFNYSPSEQHVFGAKYEVTLQPINRERATIFSNVMLNEQFYDRWQNYNNESTHAKAKHTLNAYYLGHLGRLGVELNIDYLKSGYDKHQEIEEICEVQKDRSLTSVNTVRNRLFASKLTLTYPLWNGSLDFGTEYINTDRRDNYTNSASIIPSAYSNLKEQNISTYTGYSRPTPVGQLHTCLRFEHVNFDYYDRTRHADKQNRSYYNLFPSVTLSTKLGAVQAMFTYSAKTRRPTYRELSNDVFYGNRYSMSRGNPLLKNTLIHHISVQGTWKFVQFSLSYTDERNAIVHWLEQIKRDTIAVMASYKNIKTLKSVTPMLAVTPQIGIWHPQWSVGMRKQWYTQQTEKGDVSLSKPIVMAQLSNTFSLGSNLTGELNLRYQGKGYYQNVYMSYQQAVLDVALVKTFLNKQLTVKLAGEDLLDRSGDGYLVYNQNVNLYQMNRFDHRRFMLTVRYKFNSTRSKYKGTGAGNEEKNRL